MKGVVVETELGWIGIGLSERGLRTVVLSSKGARRVEEELRRRGVSELLPGQDASGWPEKLRCFARGEATSLDGDLDLAQGTAFQQAVWRALLDIPRGETRTYGQIAERVGKPGAARAVGQAVGANPLAIVVPCHRVVAADGLGGFGGGLEMKKRLLELEGALPV